MIITGIHTKKVGCASNPDYLDVGDGFVVAVLRRDRILSTTAVAATRASRSGTRRRRVLGSPPLSSALLATALSRTRSAGAGWLGPGLREPGWRSFAARLVGRLSRPSPVTRPPPPVRLQLGMCKG